MAWTHRSSIDFQNYKTHNLGVIKICLFSFTFFSLTSYFLLLNSYVSAADTTPPITQATINPASPDGANGWYQSPANVTLSASDDSSGVKSINWQLDGGIWQSQSFSNTLNLAPNPSFENVSGSSISDWTFAGLPSSTGSSDTNNFVFGQRSAKIVSIENGWSGFNDQISYMPVSPFANLTASVWIKTQNVLGTGAFFKIYALTSTGAVLLVNSAALTATNDFTLISKTFIVSASDAYAVYLDLGLQGSGTVWFDGVSVSNSTTDTQVTNTFAAPGSHQLQYYAVDNLQNSESPSKTLSFKIDSTAPSNWREFETTQQGNDHTLKAQIKIADPTSLPDPSTGQFQYSVDGGSTWGYYSNLTSCSSNWINGGWSNAITSSAEDSDKTLEITTSPVDFCNSNWEVCKIIRFKQADFAGNSSTKDICINGAWVSAVGDVGANANISFSAAGAGDNTDGLIISGGSVSNFSSGAGWVVQNYSQISVPGYYALLSQFPTVTPVPQGKLPSSSGRFLINSSYTVSDSTIPSNFDSNQFTAVVFVNGNLTVNTDLNLSINSSILFIVSGDVLIDKNVSSLEAQFLVDGKFDTSYNGNKGQALVVLGRVVANQIIFSRNLSKNAETEPSEQVISQSKDLILLPDVFGASSVTWRETAP